MFNKDVYLGIIIMCLGIISSYQGISGSWMPILLGSFIIGVSL